MRVAVTGPTHRNVREHAAVAHVVHSLDSPAKLRLDQLELAVPQRMKGMRHPEVRPACAASGAVDDPVERLHRALPPHAPRRASPGQGPDDLVRDVCGDAEKPDRKEVKTAA